MHITTSAHTLLCLLQQQLPNVPHPRTHYNHLTNTTTLSWHPSSTQPSTLTITPADIIHYTIYTKFGKFSSSAPFDLNSIPLLLATLLPHIPR